MGARFSFWGGGLWLKLYFLVHHKKVNHLSVIKLHQIELWSWRLRWSHQDNSFSREEPPLDLQAKSYRLRMEQYGICDVTQPTGPVEGTCNKNLSGSQSTKSKCQEHWWEVRKAKGPLIRKFYWERRSGNSQSAETKTELRERDMLCPAKSKCSKYLGKSAAPTVVIKLLEIIPPNKKPMNVMNQQQAGWSYQATSISDMGTAAA